ncbi:hypothetical protein FOL47_007197 [Perkinsus chesapeaki]|uniref:Uncharacterized protein n=1 Tax=Perkinsus chesapeaki TaxID=330153 RepID=A0A7J6LMF3_PERCH|nr:hypothetical protein FOL47_007197 [Perkinsus chesapeaki]
MSSDIFPPWSPSLAFASLRRRIIKLSGGMDPSAAIMDAARKAAGGRRETTDCSVAEAAFISSLDAIGLLARSEIRYLWEVMKPRSTVDEFRLCVLAEFGTRINEMAARLNARATDWIHQYVGAYGSGITRNDFLTAVDLPEAELC